MLTVGLDARVLNFPLTGVGLYVSKLVDYLVSREVHCRLFTWEGLTVLAKWEGKVDVIPLGSASRPLWEEIRLPRDLRRNPVDIYHATWNWGVPSPNVCPSVLTIHDMIPIIRQGRSLKRHASRMYHRLTLSRSVSRARLVLADSESTRQDVINCLGIRPGKIITVHLGLPADYGNCSQKQIHDCLEEFAVSEYFIFTGGLDRRKNIDGIITAFARISDRHPDLRLLVLGEPNALVHDLQQIVDRLGISGRVHFTGYVSQEDKIALLSGARAMLYPSRYEGFGFPILEAMMCGCPVITSNVSSMPEVAGDAGILVNPDSPDEIADAMERILVEDDLRRTLSHKGEEHARSFSWEALGSAVVDAYREAMVG